jgi:hypothetical protein
VHEPCPLTMSFLVPFHQPTPDEVRDREAEQRELTACAGAAMIVVFPFPENRIGFPEKLRKRRERVSTRGHLLHYVQKVRVRWYVSGESHKAPWLSMPNWTKESLHKFCDYSLIPQIDMRWRVMKQQSLASQGVSKKYERKCRREPFLEEMERGAGRVGLFAL